ncbi:hypothetical protein, partial [Halobiforma nitratireducens]|uniref:hypothetical protein n=1 Tax=Halobiforma nitratireducens TaxID=130048 RepID=UPI0019553E8A
HWVSTADRWSVSGLPVPSGELILNVQQGNPLLITVIVSAATSYIVILASVGVRLIATHLL